MNASAELINDMIAAWNTRDIDRFVGFLDPRIEWYDLGMIHPPARGRDEVRAFVDSIFFAFPDFQYEIIPPLCFSSGESRCAIHWQITATHSKVLTPPGLAPTHRRAQFKGIDLLDIEDGKVIKILTLFDPLVAGEQFLGMSIRPRAGSVRERLFVSVQRLLAFFARRRAQRARAADQHDGV